MVEYRIILPDELGIEFAKSQNPDFVDKTNEEYVQFVMEKADESYRNSMNK